jgi:hypothetical protein
MAMSFEVSKGQKTLLFLSWLFFSSKSFKFVAKNTILHLKSGNNNKPSYFPTSILSKYTPNHHG